MHISHRGAVVVVVGGGCAVNLMGGKKIKI